MGFVKILRLEITVCGQIRFLEMFVIQLRSCLQRHHLTAAAYCFMKTRAAPSIYQGLN